MTTVNDIQLIEIPKITDVKGNLSFIEKGIIPFDIKRVYYLYDIPSNAERHGHAHKKLNQFIIALSGSFEIVLKDGINERIITLNKPNQGMLLPPGIWREIQNFSAGSVCLIIASENFEESDYVRNYKEFQLSKY